MLNFTPHTIRVRTLENRPEEDLVLESSGVARAMSNAERTEDGHDNYLEWTEVFPGTCITYHVTMNAPPQYTGIVGLPPITEDAKCHVIVSLVVAEAMKHLGIKWPLGVFVPDTNPGRVIRDGNGQIEAVRGFLRYDLS